MSGRPPASSGAAMALAERWNHRTRRIGHWTIVAWFFAIVPNTVRAFVEPDPDGQFWTSAVFIVQGIAGILLISALASGTADLVLARRLRRRASETDPRERP